MAILRLLLLLVLTGAYSAGAQTFVNETEVRDTNGIVTATARNYRALDSSVIEVTHIPTSLSYDILVNIPDSTRAFIKYASATKAPDLDRAIAAFACRRPCAEFTIFGIDDRAVRSGELRARNLAYVRNLSGIYIVQVKIKEN
ncbi:MAG: hypothetical protein V1913_04505 [Fibrobacterota bacterium]